MNFKKGTPVWGGLILALTGFMALMPQLAQSQDEQCSVIAQSAIDVTQQLCDSMGRDQACYGHVLLDAAPQSGVDALTFSEPGDIADVVTLRSLRLSAMDIAKDVWGLARLELRANTPKAVAQPVTVLLFGDVEVNNAVTPAVTLAATVSVPEYVNVRLAPSANSGVLGTLPSQQVVQAVGRLADNTWLRVELPDSGVFGWISASLVTITGDINTLPVEDGRQPHYGPMKAFYVQSDTGANAAAGCATVPASGLLIQTPEGAGEIAFLINEVDIRIGSTVFFQAQPNGDLTVSTLQGAARVRALGTESIAIAGTQVTVPMSANLAPIGQPSAPEPYNEAVLRTLPLSLLDKTVVVLPPLAPEEIQEEVAIITGGPEGKVDQNAVISGGGSGSGNGRSGNNSGGGSGNSNGGNTSGDGTSDTTGDDTSDTSGGDTSDTNNQEQPPPPPPSNPADACKNGGWQTMTDGNGNPFKNQGDCVSYFNH